MKAGQNFRQGKIRSAEKGVVNFVYIDVAKAAKIRALSFSAL
jgi:hypothetical protein